MAAMQGLCANPETYSGNAATENEIARWAVAQADALIAALGAE